MNKDTIKAAQEFLKTYGRGEKDPYAMFRSLMLFKNKPHLIEILHSLENCAEAWIHRYLGDKHTRTICVKAHYGQDCDICNTSGQWGKCYPTFTKTALAWDYSLIGETWTPEQGKNKGKAIAIDPWVVVDVPRGENGVNWNILERANTKGYGFANSPNKDQIWEIEQVEQVGFRITSTPRASLGDAVPHHPSKDILELVAKYTEDNIYEQQFATMHGVNWQLFELKEPERPKREVESGSAPYEKNKDKDSKPARGSTAKLNIKEDEPVGKSVSEETQQKVAETTKALQDEQDDDAEMARMQAAIDAKKAEKEAAKKLAAANAAAEKAAAEAAAKAAPAGDDDDAELAALKAKVEAKEAAKKAAAEKAAKEAAAKAAGDSAADDDEALLAAMQAKVAAKKAAKEAAESPKEDAAAAARAKKKAELQALLAGMDSETDDYVPPPGGRQVLTT